MSLPDPFATAQFYTTMALRRSKKDQAIDAQSPVVRALLILANMGDFNRSWRSIEDVSRIIQNVFDLPRTSKDQMSGSLIVSHLNNDVLTKGSIDFRGNSLGIFRDQFQRKTAEGKKKRMKCLFLCPPNETIPTPDIGTKWYDDLHVLPLEWESKRLLGTKHDKFENVREDLIYLVRQLATKSTKEMKTAAPKYNRKRDKRGDTHGDRFDKDPCAKKPKVAALSCPLSELIAAISEGDETTKFHLTKAEIVGLMNHVTAECVAKLSRLAEEEAESMNTEVPIERDELNNQNEPTDQNGAHDDAVEATTNKPNDPNDPNETNEQVEHNEANNQPRRFYMNSTVSILNQEFDLPNSHAVISRSWLSRLKKSETLSRKLKATISNARQYRSSPLGQRLYAAALIQAPRMSLYAAEQVIPLIVSAFIEDAGISSADPAAVAKSCPSAKTLNSFIVDGSIDSILWLEEQFRDAVAVFIACDKGNRKGIDHFPKVISWWSKKQRKVLSACIDADGSGGKSEQCATAIWHSIKKFRNAITFRKVVKQKQKRYSNSSI